MIRQTISIFAIMMATSASATEPPDYLALMEQAERLAVATTSAKTCVHFGYRDQQPALVDKAQDLIDEAERAGMPASNADTILAGALQSEKARQDARAQAVEAEKSDPAAVERFLGYWERRCESLANDAVYGRYFQP